MVESCGGCLFTIVIWLAVSWAATWIANYLTPQ